MPQPADHQAHVASETSEVEWQLDADDLDAIERWLAVPEAHAGLRVRPSGRKLIVDHYVDTPDLRLYQAGFAARLRGANGKAEATLKSIASEGDPESGLRRRVELNEPIRYALLHCLASARGVVGTRIREHAAVPELRVLFTVRTDRRTAIVTSHDGVDLGEVALDETTIEAADRTAAIRRLEVEALTPGAEDVLASFVALLRERHGLRPGTSSKFGSGLELARAGGVIEVEVAVPEVVRPSAPISASPSENGAPADRARPPTHPAATRMGESQLASEPLPEGSLAALVRDVVSTQLATVRKNEAGTRLGEDTEALHDMRVAVRRLRTALRLFAKVLPRDPGGATGEVAEIDASLRWLAAELGVVRDLDVQLERIEEWRQQLDERDAIALEPLAELLATRRHAARAAMVAALDTPRLARLYESLEELSATSRSELPKRALRPAVAGLPGILRKQYRAFQTLARRIEKQGDADAALLHAARIRAKRLRYAAEFATPIYEDPARALVSTLKRTQDVLGLHQDAEVAIAELRQLVAGAGNELPAATLFAIGEVAERYRESQRAQRLVAADAAASVRRRWRVLRAAMRRASRDQGRTT